jgi:hypothetical protein
VAVGQIFPQALRLFPVTIIPPVLYTHIPLIYNHWYIMLLKASLFLWWRPVVFYSWLLTSKNTTEHRKSEDVSFVSKHIACEQDTVVL